MTGRRHAPRLLFVASLYPNAAMPTFAPFVEHRVRRLCAEGGIEGVVIAPVPRHLLPLPAILDRYARWREVPEREERHQLWVLHPRYPMLPGAGMYLQPFALYRALRRTLAELGARSGDFDLVDAHYAYPDGVAAAMLARAFGLPFFVTARGSDLNLVARDPLVRLWLRRTLPRAAACIAVSDDLARRFCELGVDPARVHTVRNGVDFALFRPRPREAARRTLGLAGTVLLAVGELSERKGVHLLVDMLAHLPGATLVLVGDGPMRSTLEARARALAVLDRLRFAGAVPQERLASWYSAADLVLLASRREGTPNVLLEAMACGTRVVACAVGGVPEIVPPEPLGFLVPRHDPELFAATVRRALSTPFSPDALSAHIARFDWRETVMRLRQLVDRTLGWAA
ncbi:Putative teichuronic acid biosynthesis glycosyltransferase TuaC [bacterium HR40]|nr:Putative teichuronic acid biosynthesis glycosyltransferase TuaC [bacterium HR40]